MSLVDRPSLAHFAIALAAGAAMFSYAAGLVEPAAAAETHYLALWATLVLAALAGLALPPTWDLAAAAVLTTLVVWVVPHGPTRGAAVGLLLTVALAAIALRHLAKLEDQLTWVWSVAAALGLQLLCRADRLLGVDLRPQILIGVVTLPAVAALAVMLIYGQEGKRSTLLAAASAALLVPGWSVTVTLSLLSLAVGGFWPDRSIPRRMVVVAAAGLLLAALWWQPALALVLLLALLTTGLGSRWRTALMMAIVVAILSLVLPAARSWPEVLRFASLVPLLLPAALVPRAHRRIDQLQALLLAVLALRIVGGPGALAAPLALVALSIRPRGVAARLQLLWTGVLLAGSALLAGYPWLRLAPLAEVLSLFGVRIGWPHAVAILAVVWLLSLICAAISERRAGFRCPPEAIGCALLAILAWVGLPTPAELPLEDQVRVLSDEQRRIVVDLDPPAETSSIVIDTYLDHSASLESGTPVGRVVLTRSDGERRGLLLRAGFETGEWAARRPDVANQAGFRAPPHWLTWVAPGGDLFAQRYRARWSLDESMEVVRVRIERTDQLPAEASLAVFHLELRR